MGKIRINFAKSSLKKALLAPECELKELMSWKRNPDIWQLEHRGEENKGIILYLINERGSGYGFFAEINSVLMELLYADYYGLKPVVVFGGKFQYFDESLEETNAFKNYFIEIGTEEDANCSCNILIAKEEHELWIREPFKATNYDYSPELKTALADIVKKYLHIRPDLLKKFDEKYNYQSEGKKTLGVHYRGTDFKAGYEGHPVMVRESQLLDAIDDAIAAGYEKIFLATDEKQVYRDLREKYGEKLWGYDDVYRGDETTSVAFSKDEREHHKYKLGLEVLRDMYTLSRCDGLLAGKSQVSRMAEIFKLSRETSYEDLVIIDNGIYQTGKYFAVP